jgi:hypothetical protein
MLIKDGSDRLVGACRVRNGAAGATVAADVADGFAEGCYRRRHNGCRNHGAD